MYSAATVLMSDIATTTARRPQWGATEAGARFRSLSSTTKWLSRAGDDDHVRHIRAEINGAQMREVLRRELVDRAARRRDVQLASVRADDESHARSSREFRLPKHATRLEVE